MPFIWSKREHRYIWHSQRQYKPVLEPQALKHIRSIWGEPDIRQAAALAAAIDKTLNRRSAQKAV